MTGARVTVQVLAAQRQLFLKGPDMKRLGILLGLIVVVAFVGTLVFPALSPCGSCLTGFGNTAAAAAPTAGGDARTVFIHLTANFKEDDGPVCVAFNAAWAALDKGYQVELFFDQGAAYGLKQWEPGKTDLGIYDLPEDLKSLLVESFGVERDQLPKNYQDYLAFLSDRGAKVTVNGLWNALTKVEKTVKGTQNILPYVQPLTIQEVIDHRAAADIYLKF
jgi:hypothetical protein